MNNDTLDQKLKEINDHLRFKSRNSGLDKTAKIMSESSFGRAIGFCLAQSLNHDSLQKIYHETNQYKAFKEYLIEQVEHALPEKIHSLNSKLYGPKALFGLRPRLNGSYEEIINVLNKTEEQLKTYKTDLIKLIKNNPFGDTFLANGLFGYDNT
jgi:hypothetical protein